MVGCYTIRCCWYLYMWIDMLFCCLCFAFDVIPSHLSQLKLVLNADNSKLMIFSNGKKLTSFLPNICTVQGTDIYIERVTTYTYLGFIIDQNLSFKSHTENVVLKIRFLRSDKETFDLCNVFTSIGFSICFTWMSLTSA